MKRTPTSPQPPTGLPPAAPTGLPPAAPTGPVAPAPCVILPFPGATTLTPPPPVWSDQELSLLDRLGQRLGADLGLVEVASGQGERGDPWFAVLHSDGATLLHVARIDGRYVLEHEAPEPLQGPDLAHLLASAAPLAGLWLEATAQAELILAARSANDAGAGPAGRATQGDILAEAGQIDLAVADLSDPGSACGALLLDFPGAGAGAAAPIAETGGSAAPPAALDGAAAGVLLEPPPTLDWS